MADKCRRCTIPDRITARLKGSPQAARRKRRRVRFSLDQFLSGKAHQDLSARKRSADEGIVLLSRSSCQRLEPVCIMGRSPLDRPLFHLMCNDIGGLEAQLGALLDRAAQGLVYLFRKPFPHRSVVENILAENLCYVLK